MPKKLLALLLSLALCLSLAACGGEKEEAPAEETPDGGSAETVTLTVAASPTPHAVILEACVPLLAEQGIELVINQYDDYVVPNTAVEDGDEDANYFQHLPYLEEFNETRGTHLVDVAGVHIEPMGIYAGRVESLEDLPDGAVIGVPNDPTNEGRALLLLEAQGLIKLDDSSNHALGAGLNPTTDALAIESADSPYVNVLVVKEGNESNEAIQALVEALHSDTIRDFINEEFDGAVVPAF